MCRSCLLAAGHGQLGAERWALLCCASVALPTERCSCSSCSPSPTNPTNPPTLISQAKENNFKAVLESIRDLMNEDCVLPPWLHDILLGYGDPGAAQYRHMEGCLQTVDFKDTFLDAGAGGACAVWLPGTWRGRQVAAGACAEHHSLQTFRSNTLKTLTPHTGLTLMPPCLTPSALPHAHMCRPPAGVIPRLGG